MQSPQWDGDALLDAFDEAVVVAETITGRIDRWNAAAEQLFGYTAAEATSQPLVDRLIPEHLRPAHGAGLARYLATGQPGPGEASAPLRIPAQGKTGAELVVELTRRPIAGAASGGGSFVLLVLRDVTPNRQVAEARALYEAVVHNLVDGLAIIDQRDIVVFWNSAAATLYGVTAAEAVGRPVAEVTKLFYSRTLDPAETRRQSEAARVAANGGGPTVFEYHLDGAAPRDLAVLVFPIRDAAGALIGQGRLARDVTREREAERFKDELVSVVSHELRTPLASVVGFAELLLTREYPEAQRRQFLTTMYDEGRRLTGLINDFLDLQRLTSGRQQVARRPIDLLPVVQQAVASAGPDPDRPIVLDLAAGPLLVEADAERIQQVLTNLLSNARKYSPAGGEVRLAVWRRDGRQVEVAVSDRGLGLPPEAFAHLFEKFYRVDNSDRRAIRGTGLGLAICREILEAHGGRIWAESAGLGQGTRFAFTLPCVDDPPNGFDVLVIEDDPAFASLLTAELTAGGLAAARAGSAEEAWQQLATRRPQAVMLDLGLPGLSGPELLPHLRGVIGWDVPVIVVTAQAINRAERRILAQLGVLAILAKGPGVAQEAAEIMRLVVTGRERLPVGEDGEEE